MSQSRIRSFFSAVGEDDYAAQMQRERDEHAIAQEALLVQQATLRARHRRAREEGERRGPGRPRKRPAASIAITNSNNCSITAGDIIVIDSSNEPASSSSSSCSSSSPSSCTAAAAAATTAAAITTAATTAAAAVATRSRTDWLAKPDLFAQIHAAVQLHQSYQQAVTALQRDEKTAGLFASVRESTVRGWYDNRSFSVKPSVQQRVDGHAVQRSGRPPVMTQHPEVEAYVINALTSVRDASGAVNSTTIASFFRWLHG